MVQGYIVRADCGDGLRYLASYSVWLSSRIEGAWVHEAVPTARECESWETKPLEFCRATYDSENGGNRKTGPWLPWSGP